MSFIPQHKYISIADVQIKNEEDLEKCPMSLVSQGGSDRRKAGGSLSAVLSQSRCACCWALTVCQARQGPYFRDTLKL